MSVYAIGDVQGCFSCLNRLLDQINFDPARDVLWFCGDLVNRGPESLQTLRFIRSLGKSAISILGNHDLHLLAVYESGKKVPPTDSLYELLTSDDLDELMQWLVRLPLAHYDKELDFVMVHAGIHPEWSLDETLTCSREVENALSSEKRSEFFNLMYGDDPYVWSNDLTGFERLRCITNIFTRMRFLNSSNELDFDAKGGPEEEEAKGLLPWYDFPNKLDTNTRVLFGHWSTLATGKYGQCFALDAGCVWGGSLKAVEISRDEPFWFTEKCTEGGT